MVKRKLKLAQIVCAVYSLDKPAGTSRREIIRFCALRFGVRARVHEYVELLQQAVKRGLLNYFCQRYRPARLGSRILWARGKKRGQNRKTKKVKIRKVKIQSITQNNVKPKNTSSLFKLWRLKRNMIPTKQNCMEGAKKFKRNNLKLSSHNKVDGCNRGTAIMMGSNHTFQTRTKATSSNNKHVSLYKRRSYKTKSSPTKINSWRKGTSYHKAGIPHTHSNCKRSYTMNTCKGQLASARHRSCHKRSRSCHKLELKRKFKKANTNIIKQNLRTKNKKTARTHSCKQKPQPKKTYKSKRSEKSIVQKRRREILRQRKLAVVHAKSWDNLNKQLQRSQRENKKLMKSSQLVQKILSGSHGSSWDDLNQKLRRIKANS